MRVSILGAGPAGLYCALLLKRADPTHEITVIERNPADVTYGWGVVFSDRTLASFQRADYKTYQQITDNFVIWDSIDVRYRGETIRCGGHVIASIARKRLLNILQRRCEELGVVLQFGREVGDLAELPDHDLLVAADGINSLARKSYEDFFKPDIELGSSTYIWLGADKVLDAFTFIFHENEHGLFQVHAYPFSGNVSTFIVECDEQTWLNAGLDRASEADSITYCGQLLAGDLGGAALLSNNSKWIRFPTLKTRHWHRDKMVLLGDAAHTAHFSIGAGTKLAMEDAIALVASLEEHPDLETALNEYELERKPVVETFQRAAQESRTYFETLKRYLGLEPMQFAFQLLTRSGRITYDDLKFRDARFGDAVDSWYLSNALCRVSAKSGDSKSAEPGTPRSAPTIAPPPMFAPLQLRGLTLRNRVVMMLPAGKEAQEDTLSSSASSPSDPARVQTYPGAGLALTQVVAVSPEGRITPADPGMYGGAQRVWWAELVASARAGSAASIGIQLGHAGRRGSTRTRAEGVDRPLRAGNWPLMSASPLPYTPSSQVPCEMDLSDMELVRGQFVNAAGMAHDAGFDLLQLHFAQGYLIASFLSPLTNLRTDEFGGDLAARMRYPLEVFDAVRAAWPESKPISVAISASDYAKGGSDVGDAVIFAQLLKEHGCDIICVLAGQTTQQSEPVYGRGFLTPLSDRVRNEAGVPTMTGGYLTTNNEVNTILAAGRADLCVMST